MIIIKLWGGMCNQMFQYAFGYALAKKYNDKLCFDTEFYSNQPGHVGKRNIIGATEFPLLGHVENVSRSPIIQFFENKYINHIFRYNYGLNVKVGHSNIIIEKLHKHYILVPYSANCINYYDGYWQSDAYFSEYVEDVRKIFTPAAHILDKVTAWRNSINSNCCVAVHIRRGDYLNKINHGKIDMIDNQDYYLYAFKTANQILTNPIFCFFSDDIEWCRKTYGSLVPNAIFVENKCKDGALLDLFSIAKCDHGIMSPSTFGYWGNWLRDPSKESLVIFPEGDYSERFITNRNWIEIKKIQ